MPYFPKTGNRKLQQNKEEESKLLDWQLMDERNMEESNKESKSLKSRMQYVLVAAVFVFLLVGGYWAYQAYSQAGPNERLQGVDPAANQDVDEMLISTLEDELEEMQRRTRELEEENKQLKLNGSENSILMNNQDPIAEDREGQAQPANNEQPEPAIENQEEPAREVKPAELDNTKTKTAATGSVAPAKETNTRSLTNELEKQLNKISDPELSEKARTAWKQETMARFAEGAIQIVDETEGTPRRYSASIFLNLLSKVPHTIEVKEVKTNQNKKVTELRLSMQTKR
jgi:hypothetical protein